MINRNTELDGFHSLVQAINDVLGPSNGIDSEDVDENELQELMKAYVSEESEWKKYFFPSEHLPYTRNVVDKGNGKSNLVQSPLPLGRLERITNRTAHSGMGSWQEKPDS
jgi:cysteine dioxygenase